MERIEILYLVPVGYFDLFLLYSLLLVRMWSFMPIHSFLSSTTNDEEREARLSFTMMEKVDSAFKTFSLARTVQ